MSKLVQIIVHPEERVIEIIFDDGIIILEESEFHQFTEENKKKNHNIYLVDCSKAELYILNIEVDDDLTIQFYLYMDFTIKHNACFDFSIGAFAVDMNEYYQSIIEYTQEDRNLSDLTTNLRQLVS
jgi:hypothetical protein